MALPSKPLDQISESNLLALIQANEAESKIIDYKETLPGNPDSDKKEFLYDISSFANTSGGHLVYGMKAKDGLPTELVGVNQPNADGEKLRLHNMLQSGIQPRVPAVEISSVKLNNGNTVFLIRIQRSWASPHMVTYQGSSKFYSRNSAGKYPLDVSEIRSAFLMSESIGQRISAFRSDRIGKILANEIPVSVKGAARIAVHILPVNSFTPGVRFDLDQIERMSGPPFGPMKVYSGWGHAHYFDGVAFFEKIQDHCIGYTQVFRNGCVEIVDSSMLTPRENSTLLPGKIFERMLIQYLQKVFKVQKHLGVEPPFALMIALLNVRGYLMWDSNPWGMGFGAHPIDRDHLVVQEAMAESFDCDLPTLLKPAFDSIWNACGYSASGNYDEKGNWLKPPQQ